MGHFAKRNLRKAFRTEVISTPKPLGLILPRGEQLPMASEPRAAEMKMSKNSAQGFPVKRVPATGSIKFAADVPAAEYELTICPGRSDQATYQGQTQ